MNECECQLIHCQLPENLIDVTYLQTSQNQLFCRDVLNNKYFSGFGECNTKRFYGIIENDFEDSAETTFTPLCLWRSL